MWGAAGPSQAVQSDWTALCRWVAAGPGERRSVRAIPDEWQYLWKEPRCRALFYLLDPARETELRRLGRTPGMPVRQRKGQLRLVRDWRFRLLAAGCEAAYPFSTIGETGSPWR